MAADLGGRRVLVVEDEYLLASYLAETLEDNGAQVIGPVGSVRDALSLVESSDDLAAAVLDVNLGGEQVYPVADRLLDRRVPFLFTSGYDNAMSPPQYTNIIHCTKPMNPEEVVRMLSQLIEEAS